MNNNNAYQNMGNTDSNNNSNNNNTNKQKTKTKTKTKPKSNSKSSEEPSWDTLPEDIQELHNAVIEYKFTEKDSTGVPSLVFYPSPFLDESQHCTTKLPVQPVVDTYASPQNLEAVRDWDLHIVSHTEPKTSSNAFIQCAHQAWSKHYPLRLKPQHIWLLILQTISMHVDNHAEALKPQYIKEVTEEQAQTQTALRQQTLSAEQNKETQNKLVLYVQRDSFTRKSKHNDWASVIREFMTQMDGYLVPETMQLLGCSDKDFSTVSLTDEIVAKVAIMDVCKNYFGYCGGTCCGFPRVTLEGTQRDWAQLRAKAEHLLLGQGQKVVAEFGEKWAPALLPVLDRFVGAYEGDIDGVFWNSMVKRGAWHGSGAFDWFSGWINVLFPLTGAGRHKRWNAQCVPYSADASYIKRGIESGGHWGANLVDFANGISSAPVIWNWHGSDVHFDFVSGFVGYQQDADTMELCPTTDWYITENTKKNKKSSTAATTTTDE